MAGVARSHAEHNPLQQQKALARLRALARSLPTRSFVKLSPDAAADTDTDKQIRPLKPWKDPANRMTIRQACAWAEDGGPLGVVIPGSAHPHITEDGERLVIVDIDSGKSNCSFRTDPLWLELEPLLAKVAHTRTRSGGYHVPIWLDEGERLAPEIIGAGIQDASKVDAATGLPGQRDTMFVCAPTVTGTGAYTAVGKLSRSSAAYQAVCDKLIDREPEPAHTPDQAPEPDAAEGGDWQRFVPAITIDDNGWESIRSVMGALLHRCRSEDEVQEAFQAVCACAGDWQERHADKAERLREWVLEKWRDRPPQPTPAWRDQFRVQPVATGGGGIQGAWEAQQRLPKELWGLDRKPHPGGGAEITQRYMQRLRAACAKHLQIVGDKVLVQYFPGGQGWLSEGPGGVERVLWEAESDYFQALEEAGAEGYADTMRELIEAWQNDPRHYDAAEKLVARIIRRAQRGRELDRGQVAIPHIAERDVPPAAYKQGKVVIDRVGVYDLATGKLVGEAAEAEEDAQEEQEQEDKQEAADVLITGTVLPRVPPKRAWQAENAPRVLDPETGRPVERFVQRLWTQFTERYPLVLLDRFVRHIYFGPGKGTIDVVYAALPNYGKSALIGILQQAFGQNRLPLRDLNETFPPKGTRQFEDIATDMAQAALLVLDEADAAKYVVLRKDGWEAVQVPIAVLTKITAPTYKVELKGIDACHLPRAANVMFLGNTPPGLPLHVEGARARLGFVYDLGAYAPHLPALTKRGYYVWADSGPFLDFLYAWGFWRAGQLAREVQGAGGDIDDIQTSTPAQGQARAALLGAGTQDPFPAVLDAHFTQGSTGDGKMDLVAVEDVRKIVQETAGCRQWSDAKITKRTIKHFALKGVKQVKHGGVRQRYYIGIKPLIGDKQRGGGGFIWTSK